MYWTKARIYPGQHCIIYRWDLEMNAAVPVSAADEEWKHHIDGLVNNAAIQGPIGTSWTTDSEEMLRTLHVDLIAPIFTCRAAIRSMINRKHGKIVNLSGGGAAGPRPGYSAYATAKAGLVRFSECPAEELQGTGIDVNCVSPGMMLTDMTKNSERAVDLSQAMSDETMREAADLIIFLLSDESNGITGKLISSQWDDWKSFPLDKLKADPEIFTLRRNISWHE
jgi:NAD(P)-dependent dehydrogenase (short-subunit alcohol dehydrogenase family)